MIINYKNACENGKDFVFESAGMFEINASLPEENVTVNPDNKINVTLNSFLILLFLGYLIC